MNILFSPEKTQKLKFMDEQLTQSNKKKIEKLVYHYQQLMK